MNQIDKNRLVNFLRIMDENLDENIGDPGFEEISLLKANICHELDNLNKGLYLDDEKLLQIGYLAEEAYLLCKKCVGRSKSRVESLFIRTAKEVFGRDEKEISQALLNRYEHLKQEKKLKRLLLEDLIYNSKKRLKDWQLCSEDIYEEKMEEGWKKIVKKEKKVIYCGDIVFIPKGRNLYVLGDTHGDPESTEKALGAIKKDGLDFDKDYIVFLGDYVNNGLDSIGNLIKVLKLKKKHRDRVILLSGNHEFRETYYTVLKEYFETHWNNALDPKRAMDPPKVPPQHYGHIRLELMRDFGVKEGEEIYELFEEWGKSLPYMAFSAKGVMMSHSIGLSSEFEGKEPDKSVCFKELARAKQDPKDAALFKALGYEGWKRYADTLHAKMVNSKDIYPGLLKKFKPLGVKVFVVGHRHYRSGDIHRKGEMNADDIAKNEETGIFVTLSSSHEESSQAGHYMIDQYEWERREAEDTRDSKKGKAEACYAVFTGSKVSAIEKCNIREIKL